MVRQSKRYTKRNTRRSRTRRSIKRGGGMFDFLGMGSDPAEKINELQNKLNNLGNDSSVEGLTKKADITKEIDDLKSQQKYNATVAQIKNKQSNNGSNMMSNNGSNMMSNNGSNMMSNNNQMGQQRPMINSGGRRRRSRKY